MNNIFFISYNVIRLGAQMLLLNFVSWFVDNEPEKEISVLLVDEGALVIDFKKTTKTLCDFFIVKYS